MPRLTRRRCRPCHRTARVDARRVARAQTNSEADETEEGGEADPAGSTRRLQQRRFSTLGEDVPASFEEASLDDKQLPD